jgi:PAS domain S-box-containing protein
MSENQPYHSSPSKQEYVPGFPKKTCIAFLVISLGIIVAGYRYYDAEHERYKTDAFHQLSAIVSLKKGQVEAWRTERLSDANFIFRNDAIAIEARSILTPARRSTHATVAPEWMQSMYKNHHYSVIALFDRSHHRAVAFPDRSIGVTPELDTLFARASKEQQVLFSEFYRDVHGHPALSIVIPLIIRSHAASQCVGIIVLQIDPVETLYPLIQSWPIPSKSGELLLVRSAHGIVAYLNSLRFKADAAIAYEESEADVTRLAGRAFFSTDSMLEGLDYRGVATLGVVRSIVGTPWSLIAKIDADEIYAPLQQTGIFLRLIGLLVILTGGISIMSVWRHRRGSFYRRIYLQELERKRTEIALRESEERFRMLVDSLDEIVYTLDANHRLMSVYGNWVERSGFKTETLLGKTVAEIFGDAGYEHHHQMEARALAGEHVLYESTYTDVPSNSQHDILTSLSPLRDPSDAIIGIVGIGRDITKMKHLERDLLQSQKMDSLGKLAGGIAHDFNNLLAMLMGSAEMLKRNLKADAANSIHIQRIIEATDRGASIAKRLLLFSRQGTVQFQPVSVSHILTEVSEMLRYSLPKTITVTVDIQDDHGIVNGDAGHLHQAFVNLCLNAKDAMGDHGTMTLTERTVEADDVREKFPKMSPGKYVAVSIADTGTGIEPALRGRIFEPFFTTKENGKGTGLGLSIVDGIIRSHQAFMDVQSEPGIGTTFMLYFPAFTAPIEHTGLPEEEILGHGETILVVDDEALIRDLLSQYLKESGYVVLPASDANEALAIYAKEKSKIDIVITDLGMPKMSGEELFTQLHKMDPVLPVIISSGYLDGTTRDELMAKGIVDVMTKPYRLREIQRILFRHLRNRTGRV